jgi:hypothetical protein
MAKRRQPLGRFFDGIRVIRRSDSVHLPPATDAELDLAKAQLGSRLPHSYREFMKRFGPGELQDWFFLLPLSSPPNRAEVTVAAHTETHRDFFRKHPTSYQKHAWLCQLVYFARDFGNNRYAWDPAAVTCSRPFECQFYRLDRMREDRPIKAGASFRGFIEWAGSRHEKEIDGIRGLWFSPAFLRAKKRPLKRDVKTWLDWNNGTVRDLARSIREEGRADAFPVLADALEEAGCTNVDLLNSCRGGLPESDGACVLKVLRGAK